jgi:hypothetical protein
LTPSSTNQAEGVTDSRQSGSWLPGSCNRNYPLPQNEAVRMIMVDLPVLLNEQR